jgi:hypothetical protein
MREGMDMGQTTYSINEIKAMLFPIFETAPVYRAILFGSYAKGCQNENSDIDIVIDSKGELLNIAFYGVLEDITNRLGKRVDLFEITEIKNNSDMQAILDKEGVVLYDRKG